MALASARPQPYVSPHSPILHSGNLTMTATTLTVDLGIGHANFVVTVSSRKTAIGAADFIAWKYGTKAGTFIITVNAAQDVSFIALAGSSVAS